MKIQKSNHTKILELLADKKWHCGNEITKLYLKDDRKRISELNHSGYLIEGMPCDLHSHDSRLFMRRLIRLPKKINHMKNETRTTIM
jgi:hypothetical protein